MSSLLPILNRLHVLAADRGAGLEYGPDMPVTLHETSPDGSIRRRCIGDSLLEAKNRLEAEHRAFMMQAARDGAGAPRA